MFQYNGTDYVFGFDLQNEAKLRDALLFANACGALTVMGRGAIPALPTREAVLNVMLKSLA